MKTLSVKDFAALVGVSEKTVSRVLNDDPKVKASTKEHILSKMYEYDFYPNAHSRRLRSKKNFVIGVAFADYSGYSYNALLTKGIIRASDRLFYDVVIRPIDLGTPDSTQKELESFLRRTALDGLILPAPLCNDPTILKIVISARIPLVGVGSESVRPSVYCDEVGAARSIVEHLIELGHSDIGIIVHESSDNGSAHWRLQGYKQALDAASIPINNEWLIKYNDSDTQEDAFIKKLLQRADRPSAIFAFNDGVAAKVYKYALQLGIKIPHELSVVGFDDDPISEVLWPPLTTVSQPVVELGQEAANLLIKRCIMQNDDYIISPLKCSLVERSSVAPYLRH